MRILIVEDAPAFLAAVIDLVLRAAPSASVVECKSRDKAVNAIDTGTFDYAILDLKIPSNDEEMDPPETAHGQAVYDTFRTVSPGTPICFLTAFGTDDFISDRMAEADRSDVWGSGIAEPMVRMLPKGRLLELERIIRAASESLAACDGIEINQNLPLGERLTERQKRVLRIFARRNGGRSINVSALTGGMSGLRVLKTEVRDAHGAVRMTCAARVGLLPEIRDEAARYREIVRLPIGRYTPHCDSVFEGAADHAGTFYTLIPQFRSLLTVIRQSEPDAVAALGLLMVASQSWTYGHPQKTTTVQSIRQGLISDQALEDFHEHLVGINWQDFERMPVQVYETTQHGDLHGENVLIDNNLQPILIDFACVGDAPSCLDPITLELSFLFHPACRRAVGDWPSTECANNWDNLEVYVGACPFKEFLRATRAWAVQVSGGYRALYATAYAFAARQLKFPDTDKNLARAVMQCAIRAAQNT
jgi:DNA-binding NarL/FixJ family response regulator